MCNCDKPNINGQFGYKWNDDNEHTRQISAPELKDDDKVLYDLPGRCGRTDSHCHHFTVVERMWNTVLLVRHGGGEESFNIGSKSHRRGLADAIDNAANDNERYWLVQTLYHTISGIERGSAEKERGTWKRAAAQGRLKIRSRKGNKYAEILPETMPAPIKMESLVIIQD